MNSHPTISESKIYLPGSGGRISTRKKHLTCQEIKRCYTPSKSKCDWRKVISKSHWKQGKSAYQTASAWEESNPDLPQEIRNLFGVPVELLIATPEHSSPLKGRGGSSRTDVLAIVCKSGEKCVLAVEGKVDEGFGKESVEEWLKSGNCSENRIKRLSHILGKLGLSCKDVRAIKGLKDVRYQLLHRTACAVIEAERFNATHAAMIVHSFSQKQKPTGLGDFENLLCKMKVKSLEAGKLHEVTERNIPFGVSLSLGWVNAR